MGGRPRGTIVTLAVIAVVLLAGGTAATIIASRGDGKALKGSERRDVLEGGRGADRIYGYGGNDSIHGNAGADLLAGGAGHDLLAGGRGDDVIDAGDGGSDDVYCGTGADTVLADVLDVVASDCESVRRIRRDVFALAASPLLRISVGTGGRVISTRPDIDCPPRCGTRVAKGGKVTLVAKPLIGFAFAGWARACTGVKPRCVLVLKGNTSVRANFKVTTGPVGPQPTPPPPPNGTSIVLTDQKWVCKERVDLDLVKVTMHADDDAVSLETGCTGRIGRIEVDTWTDDGIKVQNSSTDAAHDLTIESGYVVCHHIEEGYHQDGIQVMGGARLTFKNLSLDCAGNANLFVAKGGLLVTVPTQVVCRNCFLGAKASTSLRVEESVSSGAVASLICPGVHFSKIFTPESVSGVDVGNVVLPSSDPRCKAG
jgi:RTX calcium-binding nonapeptide repeat (4 copies)/Divergent InlB B-repeat domain